MFFLYEKILSNLMFFLGGVGCCTSVQLSKLILFISQKQIRNSPCFDFGLINVAFFLFYKPENKKMPVNLYGEP